MNYKEKREKAEQRVLGILETVEDTAEAKILRSNLPTVPGTLVVAVDKMLELTLKAGEDVQSILEFCRVNGLMDGPVSLLELTENSVSVGIGRGMYVGFDWTDGTIGLYDDVNCRISHYHVKTQIDDNSRLGLSVALYSAVYKLLMIAGIDFSFNLYRIWWKRGVLKRLSDIASNVYPSALVKAFKMRVGRFVATDQVKKFCSVSRSIVDSDHKVPSYDIYKQVSEDGTSFYVVNPETFMCETFIGYPYTDFSDEELQMFAQFVAFCKGMPVINFYGEPVAESIHPWLNGCGHSLSDPGPFSAMGDFPVKVINSVVEYFQQWANNYVPDRDSKVAYRVEDNLVKFSISPGFHRQEPDELLSFLIHDRTLLLKSRSEEVGGLVLDGCIIRLRDSGYTIS